MANRLIRSVAMTLLASLLVAILMGPASADQLLWQLGKADDSSAELAGYLVGPQVVTVPPNGATDTAWKTVPKGLKGDLDSSVDFRYNLAAIPKYGILFSFKLLDAPKSGAQAAIYSNEEFAGMPQLWGTAETGNSFKWRKTYRLYIPKEMLHVGSNSLRVEAARPMYEDPSADSRLWWEWDFVKLEALDAPAREPVNGSVAYIGTTLTQSGHDFKIDDMTLKIAPIVLPWLGIAYCGNTVRANYWSDLPADRIQPRRLDYLKTLRDYNMTVIADNVSGSHFKLDDSAQIPDSAKGKVSDFLKQYGGLIQYYEMGNEPSMFGGPGGYAEYVALARYIDQIKPATLKVTAPGWAYGGGKGFPVNWDADPIRRQQVEQYCQATNGHSYGSSYADAHGGSFNENLYLYQQVEDGWPKEYVNSETGTNNWHSEENGFKFPTSQPKASAFDRILRAHVAVVDRTIQHALMFEDYGLFQELKAGADLSTITEYPGSDGQDSRLKTFRRLALAYATHGAPLPYEVLNMSAVAGKKVYVRAVDTSAIPAQPASEAVSNKLLLNFVNFENSPQTISVRATLPMPGTYAAERFGPGATYTAVHSALALTAKPSVDLTVSLGPGESVQYILTPPLAERPYAPQRVDAEPTDSGVSVAWAASSGASAYHVYRVSKGVTSPVKIAEIGNASSFLDKGAVAGKSYSYAVQAINATGKSALSDFASVTAGVPTSPVLVTAMPGVGSVTLSWDPVPNATVYDVDKASQASGPFSHIGTVSTPSYEDKQAAIGKHVYYAVRPRNQYGIGREAVAQATPENTPGSIDKVSSVAADGRSVLTWTPTPGAMSYVVQRATVPGGPYATLTAQVGTPTFADKTAQNGTTYRYRVAAKAIAVQGPFSPEAAVTPTAEPLPAAWSQADIGALGTPGRASVYSGDNTITILGSGANLWGNADSFHFVYQPLSGDGSLTAHVISFDNTDDFATFGVMIRASLDPGSPMADMGTTAGKGCGLVHRDKAGDLCTMSGGPAWRWIRIERHGNDLIGSVSEDAQKWRKIGTATIVMPTNVLIGLVVCSHTGSLNKTVFQDVTLSK